MNKKLFALLLVSAFALQLKADGAGSENESEAPASSAAAAAAGAGTRSGDESDGGGVVIAGESNADDDSDSGDGSAALGDGGSDVQVSGSGSDSDDAPTGGSAAQAAAAAGAGATPAQTPKFVMPGKNEGTAKGVARRLLNKVWTSKVDAKERTAILMYGAEKFDKMSVAEKAHYFNAQDAQAGLWTYRGFKGVRAAFALGFAKLVRDVMNETEDDEDEDDEVAATA